MPDKIARSGGQGGIRLLGNLLKPQPLRLGGYFGVDIASGAGHGTGTHGLASRGFHRAVNLTRHLTLRIIARVQVGIVVFVLQRQRIGGATGLQHLIAAHPAADLRQAHDIAADTRRINREGDGKLRIIRHHFGGLGEGLLKRISGVIGGLVHAIFPASCSSALTGGLARRARKGPMSTAPLTLNSYSLPIPAALRQSSVGKTRLRSGVPVRHIC